MTLRLRLGIVFAAYTIFVLAMFGAGYYYSERIAALKKQEDEQARTLAKTVTVCREIYLASSAIIGVDYLKTLADDPAIAAAACLDRTGRAQAHSDPRMIGRVAATQGAKGNLDERRTPVLVGNTPVAWAMIVYNTDVLELHVRDRLLATLRRLTSLAEVTFALSLCAALLLGASLTAPIRQLVGTVRAIAAGDLTAQARIAGRSDEFGYLARELNAMAIKLNELEELKREFISNVSHDLRGPMTAINMYVEFMLNGHADRDRIPNEYKEMLAMIMDNATRLNVFVSNVLDAAKIRAGKMQYRVENTEVAEIVDKVAALYRLMAASRGLSLAVEAPKRPAIARADPEHVEHILSNLVSNALKFTPAGGSIRLRVEDDGTWIKLLVVDTGKGFSTPEGREPYRRFDSTQADGVRGTGLGLSIVNQSVDAMAGRLSIDSAPGRGTTVTVLLPRAGVAA